MKEMGGDFLFVLCKNKSKMKKKKRGKVRGGKVKKVKIVKKKKNSKIHVFSRQNHIFHFLTFNDCFF